MRKFAIAVAVLIGCCGAVLYALTLPAVMEKNFEWTCGAATTERCVIRMRGMGHVWSLKGNPERAALWYRRAADTDDAASMFHLGWTLERKAFAELDRSVRDRLQRQLDSSDELLASAKSHFAGAAEWYRRAAEKGFAPAMNNLGSLYTRGLSGSRDHSPAFLLYTAAASAGNPVGAFNLSLAYREGRGVTRDIAQADKWGNWSPEKFNQADLSEPTLERTHIFGAAVPAPLRAKLRAAADNGPPAYVTLEIKPLKPDPRIPTFRQASEQLKGQQR